MNNYVVVLGSNLSSEFGNSAETLKKCVDENFVSTSGNLISLFEKKPS